MIIVRFAHAGPIGPGYMIHDRVDVTKEEM